MSFPRYPKYKASGVEWLGDVPEHWEVKRLKQACHVFPSNVDKKCHDGETPVVLCNYTDVYYNEKITPAIEFMAATASTEQIAKFTLRAGDTIITKDSETADDIAVAAHVPEDLPGVVCGYHLSMVRPLPDVAGAFVTRLFGSVYAKSCFAVLANGLTRVGLGQYELDNVLLPFPPHDEQTLIASFLDRETSKIDGLVGEQRRLIELLKEKRQAVISHAVTKGLNPHAPLKPSGIEWLGDVPEHWEMARVKFASHRISKGDTPSNFGMEFAVDGPVRFIKIENIGEGELIEVPTYSIDFDAHDQLTRSQLQADDIVFAIAGATTGKCAIIRPEHLPANTNQAVAYIRPNHRVNPPFLVTWLQNRRLQEAMWEMTSQSAQPNLSMENLGNLPIPIPPKDEQREIVRHVTKIGGGYLQLMAEAERGIELLQERRTALISAAVTGQIDVRGLVSS